MSPTMEMVSSVTSCTLTAQWAARSGVNILKFHTRKGCPVGGGGDDVRGEDVDAQCYVDAQAKGAEF